MPDYSITFFVEATGLEPVSKHIPQKPSTCLFLVLIVGEKQGKNKPIFHLAVWVFCYRHSLMQQHPVFVL